VDPDRVERKLAAIVSADVVGYSRLLTEDEAATIRTLTDYREIMATLIRQHRGRVVDSPGDNVLAEFPSALAAVQGAVEIQRVISARNAALPEDRKLEFRVGVHLGDVIVEGERVYGDGVNIAARLEGLAEAGGICVSATVFEQVERKLSVELEDLGEQPLKNISKPIRVYQARPSAGGVAGTGIDPASAAAESLSVPGFSGRPAIAVLPLDNLSGDPEQEHFADGIAEDLITRLSAWRWFPVIARNSSFVYKGKAVDVKQVSRDLGVRYVVEGSVRKSGNRVRVTAQVIDATTGHHIWAERYDRDLEDIFAIQDDITEAIVASLHPELWEFERERVGRQEPQNLDAWDCAQRGYWHLWHIEKEQNVESRALFERAAELDPTFVWALYGLMLSHYLDALNQWTESPAETVGQVIQAAQRAVAQDDKDPLAQLSLGLAYNLSGQQEQSIAALEFAVELNPSLALGNLMLGSFLGLAGRAEEGLEYLHKGIRLSPQDPSMWMYLSYGALVYFSAGRYEETAEWAKRSLQRRPDWPLAYRYLAAGYAHLGRMDEARAALKEMLRLQPQFSLSALKVVLASAAPDFVERLIDGLCKAGLET
jgi:adenylate cyclase